MLEWPRFMVAFPARAKAKLFLARTVTSITTPAAPEPMTAPSDTSHSP